MSTNLDKTPFVKGEALQKLIEIIAGVKKGSDLRDDEIVKLFETDEMTEIADLGAFQDLYAGKALEPGHKYKVNADGTEIIFSAIAKDEVSDMIVVNGQTKWLPGAASHVFLLGEGGLSLNVTHTADDFSEILYFSNGTSNLYLAFKNGVPGLYDNTTFTPLSNIDLSNYATKTYVTDEIAKIEIPEVSDDFIGSNVVDTAENIPVNKSTVLFEHTEVRTDSMNVSFADGLAEGREVYVVVKNSSPELLMLALPEGSNITSLAISPNETAEMSVINIAGTYFIRAVKDVAGGTCNCPEMTEITAADVEAAFNS